MNCSGSSVPAADEPAVPALSGALQDCSVEIWDWGSVPNARMQSLPEPMATTFWSIFL